MILLELLWSFFQIGLFSIGGGYAAIPLIQQQVTQAHSWLSMSEFADIVTIAEMTPGPIAINAATFVGVRIAGVPGALAATAGCVLPSFSIVLTLAYFYYRFRRLTLVQGVLTGVRPAIIAAIASAAVSLALLSFFGQGSVPAHPARIDITSVVIFAAGLFVLRRWQVNPIYVMLSAGALGVLLYMTAPLSGAPAG